MGNQCQLLIGLARQVVEGHDAPCRPNKSRTRSRMRVMRFCQVSTSARFSTYVLG